MERLIYILLSTVLVSLISFVGILALLIKEKLLKKIIILLVSLSAGTLMGGAFLHLIPEAIERFPASNIFIYILFGFLLFFIIEKLLRWHHCHDGKCKAHEFAYMSLIGDGMHNFLDGLIIAASFLADINLGIITTIAISLHEIPQEISDFGVLIYGGFKKSRALFLNFICAVAAVLGGLIGYFLYNFMNSVVIVLLPLAAGGFIYIGASDLIPEIKKELKPKIFIANIIVFILGLALMYFLSFI